MEKLFVVYQKKEKKPETPELKLLFNIKGTNDKERNIDFQKINFFSAMYVFAFRKACIVTLDSVNSKEALDALFHSLLLKSSLPTLPSKENKSDLLKKILVSVFEAFLKAYSAITENSIIIENIILDGILTFHESIRLYANANFPESDNPTEKICREKILSFINFSEMLLQNYDTLKENSRAFTIFDFFAEDEKKHIIKVYFFLFSLLMSGKLYDSAKKVLVDLFLLSNEFSSHCPKTNELLISDIGYLPEENTSLTPYFYEPLFSIMKNHLGIGSSDITPLDLFNPEKIWPLSFSQKSILAKMHFLEMPVKTEKDAKKYFAALFFYFRFFHSAIEAEKNNPFTLLRLYNIVCDQFCFFEKSHALSEKMGEIEHTLISLLSEIIDKKISCLLKVYFKEIEVSDKFPTLVHILKTTPAEKLLPLFSGYLQAFLSPAILILANLLNLLHNNNAEILLPAEQKTENSSLAKPYIDVLQIIYFSFGKIKHYPLLSVEAFAILNALPKSYREKYIPIYRNAIGSNSLSFVSDEPCELVEEASDTTEESPSVSPLSSSSSESACEPSVSNYSLEEEKPIEDNKAKPIPQKKEKPPKIKPVNIIPVIKKHEKQSDDFFKELINIKEETIEKAENAFIEIINKFIVDERDIKKHYTLLVCLREKENLKSIIDAIPMFSSIHKKRSSLPKFFTHETSKHLPTMLESKETVILTKFFEYSTSKLPAKLIEEERSYVTSQSPFAFFIPIDLPSILNDRSELTQASQPLALSVKK